MIINNPVDFTKECLEFDLDLYETYKEHENGEISDQEAVVRVAKSGAKTYAKCQAKQEAAKLLVKYGSEAIGKEVAKQVITSTVAKTAVGTGLGAIGGAGAGVSAGAGIGAVAGASGLAATATLLTPAAPLVIGGAVLGGLCSFLFDD